MDRIIFLLPSWHFLGSDLVEALEAIRNLRRLVKEINNTFLEIIPKKELTSKLEDFRPISLCNTTYKILSKVLANRVKKLLPAIISEEQTGFVPGRTILDGVIIAQEAIHSLQTNKEEGMCIKLDIKKAFDKVDWRFLCKTIEAFGFNRQFINWIFECISTPKISISVNGSLERFFEISRGLRQGDPIFPFLFIIMAEGLGRAIKKASYNGKISGIKVSRSISVSHQQFADDTMLFGSSSKREARQFRSLLSHYEEASGQQVNCSK